MCSESEGLDYAFVTLRPYYRRLLEANGVVPITEDLSAKEDTELDKYFLIGLPEETVERSEVPNPGSRLLRAYAPASAYYVQKLDDASSGCRPTTCPRFVGELSKEHNVGNIAGTTAG